jgi:hypothetical protein
MISLSIKVDTTQSVRHLGVVQRQARYATARTLTQLANMARQDLRKEMLDVYDRPKPYTLNSIFTKPATVATLTSIVGLKDTSSKGAIPASKYLLASIKGGFRRIKRFEVALRRAGVLPDGMVAVAGKGATMDAYGNVTAGQIVQILSYFRAFPEAGYKSNATPQTRAKAWKGGRTKRGQAYFVGRPGDGKLPLGVWKRVRFASGTAIKPILIFVDGAVYERIFELGYIVKRTVERNLDAEFRKALTDALATAR